MIFQNLSEIELFLLDLLAAIVTCRDTSSAVASTRLINQSNFATCWGQDKPNDLTKKMSET